jgi:hypothetical protein
LPTSFQAWDRAAIATREDTQEVPSSHPEHRQLHGTPLQRDKIDSDAVPTPLPSRSPLSSPRVDSDQHIARITTDKQHPHSTASSGQCISTLWGETMTESPTVIYAAEPGPRDLSIPSHQVTCNSASSTSSSNVATNERTIGDHARYKPNKSRVSHLVDANSADFRAQYIDEKRWPYGTWTIFPCEKAGKREGYGQDGEHTCARAQHCQLW